MTQPSCNVKEECSLSLTDLWPSKWCSLYSVSWKMSEIVNMAVYWQVGLADCIHLLNTGIWDPVVPLWFFHCILVKRKTH